MTSHTVASEMGEGSVRAFSKALLKDLQALEKMLEDGLIESGVRRFGCEQEMFLVNEAWRPAPVAMEVLERLDAQAFTTELARFNLEMNLEPMILGGACFSALQGGIEELLGMVREAAGEEGAHVVLVGILPTLGKSDLTLDNITPLPRYHALNESLTRMRGGAYRLQLEGHDELQIEHDSVMLEACNSSCQVHLQVDAAEFAAMYNVAQAMTGPVLAAAVNSPILFGKRLWAETRIALFRQALDTRSTSVHLREFSARVRFGDRWVKESVAELFEEDIAQFRVLLAQETVEDPFQQLAAGDIPNLQALQLHNGTVYRWNRPCYGISEGKPHLRIECRVLPSGPTVLDEVANAAFWIGLVLGAKREYGDITERLSFDDAKHNFLTASRQGLNAGFRWVDGQSVTAPELLLETLIPLARAGLEAYVDRSEIDKYLGVIHDRVESRGTGSDWMMRSLSEMNDRGTRSERMTALTAAIASRQLEQKPCHEWDLARLEEAGGWARNYVKVEHYMTTQLFTVQEDELLEMVAFLMERNQIRHVPVEDDQNRLVGLVSYRSILRMVSDMGSEGDKGTTPVKTIMEVNPVTVTPETSTLEAIDVMRKNGVSCLPVLKGEKLVGLVTEADFMPIAYELLEKQLKDASTKDASTEDASTED
ncbi:MAG: CBS domain-containing protein [Gemmatimonadetes bacterium]|nr:CBS domain-containing protein [Gemmatimonadota bacterium]